MVEILDSSSSPSVFLHGMKGSKLPIAVSHGEGRAFWPKTQDQVKRDEKAGKLNSLDHKKKHKKEETLAARGLLEKELVSLRYLDNHLQPTEAYPANPNGSPAGIAGLMSGDGRYVSTFLFSE